MRNCSRVSCVIAAWQYWITDDQDDRSCLPWSSLFRWAEDGSEQTEAFEQSFGGRLGVAPRDQSG